MFIFLKYSTYYTPEEAFAIMHDTVVIVFKLVGGIF